MSTTRRKRLCSSTGKRVSPKDPTPSVVSNALGPVVVLIAVLFSVPVYADCPPDHVCTTGEAINAAADGLCRRARAAELRLGDPEQPAAGTVLYQLGQEQQSNQQCQGRVVLLEEQLAKPKADALPKWLQPVWTVAAVGTSAAAGACVASGCPRELSVGLVVAALLIDVGKVVFELYPR